MRLLFECFKHTSLQHMHHSALVYHLFALKCRHTPKIIVSLFLMLHQTTERIEFNSITFVLVLFSSIQRLMQTVTLSLAGVNGVKNKIEKAEHLKLQIICIIIKWVTSHCAWSTRATASRLAVHSVIWQYITRYVKSIVNNIVWYYWVTNYFWSRESALTIKYFQCFKHKLFKSWFAVELFAKISTWIE